MNEPASSESGDAAASAQASAPTPTETAAAPSASKSGPAKPISVGLLLGYGIDFDSGPNPWSLGFGVRGGYNLDKIYLGARFVYYIGGSETAGVAGGGTTKVSVNLWELGIEGGYDFAVADKLVVRPELGIGLADITAEAKSSFVINAAGSTSTGKFYIAPGATLIYDATENIFVGLDARFMFVLSSGSSTGLILLANGGMRF